MNTDEERPSEAAESVLRSSPPEGGEYAETNQALLKRLADASRRIDVQEKAAEKINNLLLLGFAVLLATVGGLVASNVMSQIQTANEANAATRDSLNRLDDKIETINRNLERLNTELEVTAP